jgi:hypothetical protein
VSSKERKRFRAFGTQNLSYQIITHKISPNRQQLKAGKGGAKTLIPVPIFSDSTTPEKERIDHSERDRRIVAG